MAMYEFSGFRNVIRNTFFALLLVSLPCLGEKSAEDEFYIQQYRGIDAVIWVCKTFPRDVVFTKKICDRMANYLELQLARTDIDFVSTGINATSFQIARERVRLQSVEQITPITVHLSVSTVDTRGTHPVHSLLTFQHYYSDAVDEGAVEGDFGALPRSGTLILDEAEFLGIGSTACLVDTQTNDLKSSLDKMLARLIRYSK